MGIITAFNFPVAVSFWNAALSMAAGNTHIIKGADTTPLCSIALTKIVADVLVAEGISPAVSSMIVGRCVRVPLAL